MATAPIADAQTRADDVYTRATDAETVTQLAEGLLKLARDIIGGQHGLLTHDESDLLELLGRRFKYGGQDGAVSAADMDPAEMIGALRVFLDVHERSGE